MPRNDEFGDMKARYWINLERGEGESQRNTADGDLIRRPITPTSLAILVVGARICKLLIDLAQLMALFIREMRLLRLFSMGMLEEMEKEEKKPKIWTPH